MARGDKKGRESKKPKQETKKTTKSAYQTQQGTAAVNPFKIRGK